MTCHVQVFLCDVITIHGKERNMAAVVIDHLFVSFVQNVRSITTYLGEAHITDIVQYCLTSKAGFLFARND